MKRTIAFVIVVTMCVISVAFVFTAKQCSGKAAPLIIENGEFRYASMFNDDGATYSFYYNEGWFKDSAENFKPDLARMSLRVAMAAASTDSADVEKLLSDIQFKSENISVTYPKPTRNTIGYVIAHKKINEGTLILCAVRGGGYGAEWADNFNIGTEGNHLGFETQAKKVENAINKYVSEKDIDKDKVKIWITGFSRGAATSNIAAHDLSGIYGNNDVYAYCFECPLGVDKANIKSVDKNIFNIINDIDFITYMAPEEWNFGRYGINCYLPSKVKTDNYEEAREQMSLEYGKIFAAAMGSDGKEDATLPYVSPECNGQAQLIEDVFQSITKVMTRKEADEKLFRQVSDTLAKYYEDGSIRVGVDKVILDCVTKVVKSLGVEALGLYLRAGMDFDEFVTTLTNTIDSHYPELCLAWLDTVTTLKMNTENEGLLTVENNKKQMNGFKIETREQIVD